jgi:hypothetical protein
MRKALRLTITLGAGLAITLVTVLLFASLPALSESEVTPQQAVLENGEFEGDYLPWEGQESRKIAPSWSLWYTTDWPEPFIAPPHASEETRAEFVRQGKAQGVHTDGYQNFDACLYQQIAGITAGHYIRFSAWVKVDAHEWFDSPDRMQTRIGIDPEGGTNPLDINYYVHPDLWDTYTGMDQWQHLSVVIKATSSTATVYACAHPDLARPFHVYWDDATFLMTPESRFYLPYTMNNYYPLSPRELANPDLEENWGIYEGYQIPIPGYGNVQLAPYWWPYWDDDFVYHPDGSINKQPEYGPTGENVGRPFRRHSGRVAQQMGSSGGGIYDAGIYQVVRGTEVGDVLRFSMWSHGWTQRWPNDDDPLDERVSDYQEPGGLNFQIGIDPYGGESFTSTHIVWCDPEDPYDEWYQFVVTATAMSDRISVWTRAQPSQRWLKSNESFWDNASLEVVESATANFSSATYSVEEGVGAAQVTVTLDMAWPLTVSVDYATSDGTAQAPDDYTAISGTLNLEPGSTSAVLEVTIADDDLEEGDETILLTLTAGSNAVIGENRSATLTILDNDPVTDTVASVE